MTELKSELCEKWEDWIEGDEGRLMLMYPGMPSGNTIKERLAIAFLAGAKAQEEFASEAWAALSPTPEKSPLKEDA